MKAAIGLAIIQIIAMGFYYIQQAVETLLLAGVCGWVIVIALLYFYNSEKEKSKAHEKQRREIDQIGQE